MQLGRGLIALVHIGVQGLHDDLLQLGRNCRVDPTRGIDIHRADLLEGRKVGLGLKQTLIAEDLPEHHPEGKHVTATIDGRTPDLLGRHVPELALENAGLGLGGPARSLGDTEVDQLHLPLVGDEDIRWTDIAVDQPQRATVPVLLVVGVLEALADLHNDVAGLGQGHWPLRIAPMIEHAAQVSTRHVFEHDVKAVALGSELIDRGDVRVLKLRRNARFVLEHRNELFILRHMRQDSFDRYDLLKALDTLGDGFVDLCHPTECDATEDFVLG